MNKAAIELFAGVGGFRLGIKDNFEVVWGNQWEPGKTKQHAFNCYAGHFKEGIHSNENISLVDSSDIPEHTLLVGGFPCQDYSVARTGSEGIKGKKGVLFWDIKRIVSEKSPSFVLLENVDRLLKSPSKQRGRDFAVMLKTFDDLGYSVEWRVINAAEYGNAQKRRRVFIFASKRTNTYSHLFEESSHKEIIYKTGYFAKTFPVLEEEHEKHKPVSAFLEGSIVDISDKFSLTFRNSGFMSEGRIYTEEVKSLLEKPKRLGDVLESSVDERYYLSEEVVPAWKYLKDSKRIERTSATGHTYFYSEGQMAFPDDLSKPGRTMLTSEGSKNRSSHVIKDPETGRLRILTPVECERLNGFPDNWTNTGMTERMRYFCMGNALVVDLIKRMSETLSKIVDKEK